MHRKRALRALIIVGSLTIGSVALAQALPAIAPGGPAQAVHVPMAPTPSFTVAAPGEFQIDAIGGSMDAQLMLIANGSIVTQDSDSGDGVNARIVTFLDPGTYGARVFEWQGRAMTAQVSVSQLGPLTPVATIAPGAPPTVIRTAAGDSPRSASSEVTLTIATPGTYRIDVVSPDGSVDAEVSLIQNGGLVQSDSDSGEGTNAQLVRQLAPGNYTLRVRDWLNRAASLTVTVAQ